MAKQLSSKLLYIRLQHSIVKLSILFFVAIIETLHKRWVYKLPLSQVLGDMNLYIDNWIQISLYSYQVLAIEIMSQYEHITLMMLLILLLVSTEVGMVEGEDDEAGVRPGLCRVRHHVAVD